jgi:hypothetical protein
MEAGAGLARATLSYPEHKKVKPGVIEFKAP